RLARTLEADRAGRRPADHGTRGVGDGDDRVVERRLDVGLAHGDVLLLLAARLARGGLRSSHYFLPAFFLPATVRFGPLRVRAVGAARGPRTGGPRRWRRRSYEPVSTLRRMSACTSRSRSPSTL